MTTIKAIDVTLEKALLKDFLNRETYEKYIEVVDFKRLLPNTRLLLADYGIYYNLYPETKNIDLGVFYTHFAQDWHNKDMEQNDLEYYRDAVFPAIATCETIEAEKCLLGLMHKKFETQIQEIGTDVHKLREAIEAYEAETARFSQKEVNKALKTASMIELEAMDKSKGIPWFLPSLRRNLVSLVKGQFVVVSADWGTGKSAFVLSQAVCAFKYLCKTKSVQPIWYINSEGTEGDVLTRFWSNMYQEKIQGGFEEVWERRSEVLDTFTANFNEKLFVVSSMDDFPDFPALKSSMNNVNPSLIIIDICDELVSDEDPKNLKKLYGQLRRLSNQCPIIGTTQSGDTSYKSMNDGKMEMKNEKWLSGSKTYGSKTGKPGAADTIITIGKDDETSMLRYVSVPKKKRGEPVKIICELVEKYSCYKELLM